jgi:hypothetical protein
MGQSNTRNEVRAPGHGTMEKDVLPLHYSCSRLSESPNTMTSKSDGGMSEDYTRVNPIFFSTSRRTFLLSPVRLQFRTQTLFCNVPCDPQASFYIEFQFNIVSLTLREGFRLMRLHSSEVLRRYMYSLPSKPG